MHRGKHLLLLCLLFITGCTRFTPVIDTKFYLPLPEVLPQLSNHAYLRGKIEIGDVQVSIPKLNGSPGPYSGFKDGLVAAFSEAKMLGSEHSPYILDANLKDARVLDRDWGYTELLTTVEYSLRERRNGRVVYQETLNVPYRNDNTMNDMRAKIAEMGLSNYSPGSPIEPEEMHLIIGYHDGIALRENITQLLRILSAKTKSDLAHTVGE